MKIKSLSFALTLLCSTAVFAQDYEIKLVRPFKVGDEYKIEATGKQAQEMVATVNGAPQQNTKTESTVTMVGVEKVLAVDALGRESKVSITVEKLTKTSEGATVDLATKGALITSGIEGKKQITDIDGKPVDGETAQLIKLVIPLNHFDRSDDEIFGSKDHKKKSDTWDINGTLVKESIEKDTPGLQLENFTGKTTLDDVVGGSLKISAHLSAGFKPPLPPMFTIDKSVFEANFSGLFPTDLTKPQTDDSVNMSFSFTAHADAPSGEKILMNTHMLQSTSRKITPVK